MNKGRSLELYFIDGKPDGMLTAEISNWFGHVLMTPRTRIKDALERKETSYTGVYILQGEFDGKSHAYIGEAEDLGKRLRGHLAKMDWWKTAVLITSTADNLHKAHVKYLEARLVEMALAARLMPLKNGNAPSRSSLSEAATANMEEFLETLMMVLPAIQVDYFMDKRQPNTPPPKHLIPKPSNKNHVIFELQNDKHHIHATARALNGKRLLVHKGSIVRGRWAGSETHNYKKLHNTMLQQGIIQNSSDEWVFTQDYEFLSPSAAAAIINGRAANGRKEWKLKGTNTTYAEWEAAQLAELDNAT